MQTKTIKVILDLFMIRVIENSKKYGMGQAYIQGQLEEACHQLKLHGNKMHRNLHYEF